MKVDFKRLTWENYPSTQTPINADNLNRLEEGVAGLYSDITEFEKDVTSMGTSVTSMETRVTSMENGLPTMVSEQIDNKFGDDIGDNVTAWLTEHVTPSGSAVVVDDTLTIEGAAADAKKTGDEISGLKEDYPDILNSAYVTDTASGSIASFQDGANNVPVKSLKVNIEPVQDLHGYDSPWPAGGGKNLLNITATSRTVNGVTFTINKDDGGNVTSVTANGTASATIYFYLQTNIAIKAGTYTLSGCPAGGDSATYALSSQINSQWQGNDYGGGKTFTLNEDGSGEALSRIEIVIKNGITVNNIVFKPMLRLATETDATFAPYSNICPINGHTSAKVTRTGKNLINPALSPDGVRRVASVAYENGDNEVTVTSTNNTNYMCLGIYYFLKAGTYAFKYSATSSDSFNPIISFYRVDGVVVRSAIRPNNAVSFTLLEDAVIEARMFVSVVGDGIVGRTVRFYNMQLEFGSTATDYEPYAGQVYDIEFPTEAGTVYGGTLDVGTGVLTVDRVGYTFTDGTGLVEGTDGDADWLCVKYKVSDVSLDTNKRTQNICSYAPFTFANVNGNTHFYTTADVFQLFVSKSKYASLSAFTSSLGTNPLTFTAFLSTPQTVQLTANDIKTLLGTNNIWSDAGDVEVDYRADTKLYIEKLTAPTEDDMIADHAISANSFFMIGNTLYRATTAIASGATITVGTNATKLSLSDALNALA